jgi:hypothetical protein
MNALRLQQDHPCVIEMIRKHFLIPPSPPDVPYKLTFMGRNEWPYPTDGITARTLHRLNYKVFMTANNKTPNLFNFKYLIVMMK